MVAGVVNIILRVPVWMQVTHLLLADAVWIVLILTTASALAHEPEPAPSEAPARVPAMV